MAYGNFEDLTQRTGLDKVLCHKTFDIDENLEMMNIKEILFQWFITVLIKKNFGKFNKENVSNKIISRRIKQTNY